jgi:hypothetical protein
VAVRRIEVEAADAGHRKIVYLGETAVYEERSVYFDCGIASKF